MSDAEQQPIATDHPETLDAALEHAWGQLDRGIADRRHGFRLPVLATVDESGNPASRTVVLRLVDRASRLVACHADARSPKVIQLERHPVAAWTFYDPNERVQVRLKGRVTITRVGEDPRADAAWARTSASAKRCYLAPRAPSTPAEAPSGNIPRDFTDTLPTDEDTEAGLEYFRFITLRLAELDWLHLRHDGHRRAGFTWNDAGRCISTWLEP